MDSIHGRACRFFFCGKAKRSWRQKGNNSLSGIMRDCRLELRGKGVAVRPTDVAFLSNGPIILFNFSIFLPSSIGAIQPFVARGRRRRVGQPLPLSPQNDRNHLPFWASKSKSPLHSSPSLEAAYFSATCRFHHNTILFVSPGSDTLFDELSEMREEDRGGWGRNGGEGKNGERRMSQMRSLPPD